MRKTPLYPGDTYHIYNRGVNHGNIFFTRENWIFFLRRFREYCSLDRGAILAYCLMPNHYHLILTVNSEDFGLKVMQPFTVSYTKAINKQESRVGPIFQGPFQAREVTTDGDLVHLSRYVHLNPVTVGFVAGPAEWEFSSYRDYVGLRAGTLPQPETVMRHFRSARDYIDFVCGSAVAHAGMSKSLLIDFD